MPAIHVIISGRVQGVAFRAWLSENARASSVDGWTRNRRDGTVEAVLSGLQAPVDELVTRLRRGPPAASVDDVAVSDWRQPVPPGFKVLATE